MVAQIKKPSAKSERRPEILAQILCALLAWCVLAVGQSRPSSGPLGVPHDPQTEAAFDHFYNLEYDQAIEDFTAITDQNPTDTSAWNHLAHGIQQVTAIRVRPPVGASGAALEVDSKDGTRTLLELSRPEAYELPPPSNDQGARK